MLLVHGRSLRISSPLRASIKRFALPAHSGILINKDKKNAAMGKKFYLIDAIATC
jgi:hypothetical protein